MKPHFNRVTIIGVGLLGASLGLAMKARRLAAHVVGVGHRMITLDTALARRAIDEASLDAAAAVKDADLVVLCTPVVRLIGLLDAIRPYCTREAVVTDVGSTKAALCAHAVRTWPTPRRFVGSHPMAGSEKFGPEHADADFYAGSVCLVETGPDLDAAAREVVVALWRAVDARVVDIDPALHDEVLAHTSHLPHVVASALARTAARHGKAPDLVGKGFHDTTRIADSRPEIWSEICLTNREAILAALAECQGNLEQFRAALAAEDGPALERLFEEGRAARRRVIEG